jgi:hypothetical protein
MTWADSSMRGPAAKTLGTASQVVQGASVTSGSRRVWRIGHAPAQRGKGYRESRAALARMKYVGANPTGPNKPRTSKRTAAQGCARLEEIEVQKRAE